jgi:putative tryptophan/tyrosine transport system substrate-binding protein
MLDPAVDVSDYEAPLKELGYIKNENLELIARSAQGDPKRLAALAEELALTRPDVLVAGWGTLAPKALKAATADIPIVVTLVGDPVGAGLVQSLARPGGNLTGLSAQSTEFKGKQLELLLKCVPGQRTVAVLLNPDTPFSALSLKALEPAAAQMGIQLKIFNVRRPADFTSDQMDVLVAAGATSLLIVEDPLTSSIAHSVLEQATRLRLPTITGLSEYVRYGGLIGYGIDRRDIYRRAAGYIDKVLKGAKPSDLPVEVPTKFVLTLNLKTAKSLGIEIPPSLLLTADEIIE